MRCCVMLHCVVLCCVALCCVVLCCVVLCCVVLCCVVLCCVVLCCVVLCCVVLCCVVLCCVPHCHPRARDLTVVWGLSRARPALTRNLGSGSAARLRAPSPFGHCGGAAMGQDGSTRVGRPRKGPWNWASCCPCGGFPHWTGGGSLVGVGLPQGPAPVIQSLRRAPA